MCYNCINLCMVQCYVIQADPNVLIISRKFSEQLYSSFVHNKCHQQWFIQTEHFVYNCNSSQVTNCGFIRQPGFKRPSESCVWPLTTGFWRAPGLSREGRPSKHWHAGEGHLRRGVFPPRSPSWPNCQQLWQSRVLSPGQLLWYMLHSSMFS